VKDESDEAAADDGMDVDGTPKKKVYMSLVKVGNTIIKQIIKYVRSLLFDRLVVSPRLIVSVYRFGW